MTTYRTHKTYKRFILTGDTARIFRSIFDSYYTRGATEEQSALVTCAMGTVIGTGQLARVTARLNERNTFLSRYKWDVRPTYCDGNDMDEYDEDGVLISFYDDEAADVNEPTEADAQEWRSAPEILARILYEEKVKPGTLKDGRLGYMAEPDAGRRMQSLRGQWRFNAKFIVEENGDWRCPVFDEDDFSQLAEWYKKRFPGRHNFANSELYEGFDLDEITFPLPTNLQKGSHD